MSRLATASLIAGRTSARSIIRSDKLSLVLPSSVFGLTEGKAAIAAHPLSGTDFLDRFLEST